MPSSNALPPEAAALLAHEIAAEAARAEHRRRELSRHQGVCWAGVAPEPPAPRSPRLLQARVEERLAARNLWRSSADGNFVTAIAACQTAAQTAHALGERARAGSVRGEPAQWRRQILQELSLQVHGMAKSLRQATQALEDEA